MSPHPLPGEVLRVLPAYVFGWTPDGDSLGRVDDMVVTFLRRVPGPRGSRVSVVAVLRPDGRVMHLHGRYLTR